MCHGIYLDRFIYHLGDLNTSFGFPNDATDTFTVNTTSTERLRIDPTGILKLYGGAYSYIYGHRGGNLTYILGNDSGTNHFNIKTWQSSSDIIFSLSGNNEKVRITSAGRVGIGSEIPDYMLDVSGAINSETDVKVGGVSVSETALNDAVAMAIALG